MISTKIIPLLALGFSILAEKSAAQTSTTTTCSSYSVGAINCQSQTSPDASAQLRAATDANERSFNEFFAALQARRDRNALAAERERMNVQLVAELAAQREEARTATRRSEELSQDRDETARQAQEASMRAEEVRDQARLDLFSQRADFHSIGNAQQTSTHWNSRVQLCGAVGRCTQETLHRELARHKRGDYRSVRAYQHKVCSSRLDISEAIPRCCCC